MSAERTVSARQGFSTIELLLVISVMFLLSTLSITGITRSMRVATVTNAVGAIQTAATTAQNLAMRLQKSDGQQLPGIVIAQKEGRWAVATVMVAPAQAQNATLDDAITDEQGRKAISVFSPNVVLWMGDAAADAATRIAWFYDSATGRVIIAKSGGFSAPGAMVGYTPPALASSGGEAHVFGARAGTYTLNVLAPPTATSPGLSLRSRDQRTKRSLIVQPSGTLQIQEF